MKVENYHQTWDKLCGHFFPSLVIIPNCIIYTYYDCYFSKIVPYCEIIAHESSN